MATKIIKAALIALLIALALVPAVAPQTARAAASASDLIAAVNALRASKGVAQLTVDPALMKSAQGQADYEAAIGTYTSTGPGGSTPTSRGVAAGFGAGGSVFVSENVAYQPNAVTLDTLIFSVWSDALHQGTMLNPKYTRVGAGVTVNGPFTYYIFDAGQILEAVNAVNSASSGQAKAQIPPTATVQLVAPVITSTSRPDGSIYHLVQFGQTLIQIAQAYGMTVAELQKLNNLGSSSTIFEGQKLFIQGTSTPTLVPSATLTPVPPTSTPTKTRTSTPTALPPTATLTPTTAPLIPDPATWDNRTIGEVILGISAVGLLLVLVGLFIRKKPS